MEKIHIITNDTLRNMLFIEQEIRNNRISPQFYCNLISLADLKKNIPYSDICILVEQTNNQIFPKLDELIGINPKCIFIYYWDTQEKQHELFQCVVQRKRGSYVTLVQKIIEFVKAKPRT